MKKLLFPVLFFTLIFQVFAQNKSAAVKFDEFDDSTDSYFSLKETSLLERLSRLVQQMKRARGKQVYVIFYQARKSDYLNKGRVSYWAEITRSEISNNTKLQYDDVIIINGGYREKNTLEYWIAPKNAEPPKPTPTFTESEAFTCPNIYLSAEEIQFDKNEPVTFVVSTYPKADLTYEWKVSSGKIIEGQGRDFIKVDISNSDNNRITAFVEVGGFPLPCEKVAFKTVEISNKPYQFDSAVRYNFSDLSARLDGFMVALQNQSAMTGYIIIYANRKDGVREMELAIRSVQRYFAFRRYDLSRINIVRGGFREYNTVDTWLVPPGVNAPVPTPSVDLRFIEVPRKNISRKKTGL